MKCPACQFENPKDKKFCNECGSKMEVLCPQCGADDWVTRTERELESLT